MTAAIVAGLGFAGGVLLILSGAFPAPLPVDRALAQLHRERTRNDDASEESRLDRVLGRSWAESALGAKITLAAAADLRVTGETATSHLAQRAAFGLLGLLWAPLVVLLMSIGGVRVGRRPPVVGLRGARPGRLRLPRPRAPICGRRPTTRLPPRAERVPRRRGCQPRQRARCRHGAQ